MNSAHSLWLIFILLGLATVLPRASFIVLGTRVALSSVVQRAFRYATLLPHSPCGHCRTRRGCDRWGVRSFQCEAHRRVVAAASVMLSRNPWLPFIAGMGALPPRRIPGRLLRGGYQRGCRFSKNARFPSRAAGN
jgi:hypothetical protein